MLTLSVVVYVPWGGLKVGAGAREGMDASKP